MIHLWELFWFFNQSKVTPKLLIFNCWQNNIKMSILCRPTTCMKSIFFFNFAQGCLLLFDGQLALIVYFLFIFFVVCLYKIPFFIWKLFLRLADVIGLYTLYKFCWATYGAEFDIILSENWPVVLALLLIAKTYSLPVFVGPIFALFC